PPAAPFYGAPLLLIKRIQRVIPTFNPEIRLRGREKLRRLRIIENAYGIDSFQGGQRAGAVFFGVKGTPRAFKGANTRIAVHSDEERVALVPSCFKGANVSQVEQVETAVGYDKLFASRSKGSTPCGEILEANNFAPKVQRALLFRALLCAPFRFE